MVFRFTLLASVLVASAVGQFYIHATLYDQLGGVGNSVTTTEEFIEDLTTVNFNDRARSASITGVWIFYEDPNHNQLRDAGVEYSFGLVPAYSFNFDYLAGKVSSVRFGGVSFDYSYSVITIYEFEFFQGRDEYHNIDRPNLSILEGSSGSIILTGLSAWTVYDERNYGGNAICIYPPASSSFAPGFLTDVTTVGIPYNSIKSIRKGCFGRRMVRIEASTHGSKPGGVSTLRS